MLIEGLPRTLVGVGGIRLINIPGVRHSESFLKVEQGMNALTGKPYKAPPEKAMTTREAAVLMRRSISSAYNFLRKHRVTYYYVESGDGKVCTYWNRKEICLLEESLPKIELHVSKEYITARDALKVLQVVRSTLYRYVASGKLREFRRRVMTRRGYRYHSLFLRSEVMKLAAWRRACVWKSTERKSLARSCAHDATSSDQLRGDSRQVALHPE